MPRKLRRPKTRIAELSPGVVTYLLTGALPTSRDDDGNVTPDWLDAFIKSGQNGVGLRPDWIAAREDLLVEWIAEHPGSRPWAFWRFDAPRWPREDWPERQRDLGPWADNLFAEPRKQLSGIGTPTFEVMNCFPMFASGVPSSWVDPFSVEYYNGLARDIHGAPIGTEYHLGDFEGLAIDPNDPPVYESEASYLQRHGLLLPGELKRLTADAFEPVIVRVDDEAPG